MPTLVNSYLCNVCGAKYETENQAAVCEINHIHAQYISGEEYTKRGDIPASVDVKMSDGSVVTYYLLGRNN